MVATNDVSASRAVATNDVSASRAVATNDVSAPRAVATNDVSAPRAVVTNDVSAPRAVATNNVSAPRAVATIADIPFRQAPPDDLLGIDWGRPRFVDDDHIGFGWGIVPRLSLVGTTQVATHHLTTPLVLALHSATREPDSTGPFDLELVIDGERLHIPLDRFLAVWLPRLPTAPDLVLALCNPTAYPIGPVVRPKLAPPTRLWVAMGDVDSSAEQPSAGPPTWLLTAPHWITL